MKEQALFVFVIFDFADFVEFLFVSVIFDFVENKHQNSFISLQKLRMVRKIGEIKKLIHKAWSNMGN